MSHFLPLNIKYLREEARMKKIDLAETINKTSTSVAAYENGSTVPPLGILLKLSRHFDVTLDDLVNRDLSQGYTPASEQTEQSLTDEERKEIQRLQREVLHMYRKLYEDDEQ